MPAAARHPSVEPDAGTRGAPSAAGAARHGLAQRRPESWRTARGTLLLDRPRILGVLNLTPDSFWQGGRHTGLDSAVAHAERLIEQGTDLIDIGGESTRPGAAPVSAAEETARVLPVVRELVRRWPDLLVSVDTVKAEVARAALAEGAAVINDVSGLRLDPRLGRAAAEAGAGLVLMHSRGTVETMASYELARYGADPVGDIVAELAESLERAGAGGVDPGAVVLDPGLGFAKRTEHSIAVLARLDRLLELGRPVLVGPSRKRFVGELAGELPPAERLEGTIAACVAALFRGAHLFRVHDVRALRRALAVAEAILAAT
ncbi:MAG: dihydropteroate synthase [Gemmatimonadetes bacterium]|nr:dihydropteroate synthase [Gemmatimonadota bacterium]